MIKMIWTKVSLT
ncbi:unnamed protein product [Oikopleura dioica]|uniref:Uncharacterized protein n=1 Tax=Oikopleura dioica TaxID=34765 RepID=E4XDY1_OIKDI|nr:unnamed protein product [Oikopleura dioica]